VVFSISDVENDPPARDTHAETDRRLDIATVLKKIPYGHVLSMYHGLDGYPLNFREIGEILGVTSSCAGYYYRQAISAYRKVVTA